MRSAKDSQPANPIQAAAAELRQAETELRETSDLLEMIERDLEAGQDVDLARHTQLLDLQRHMKLRVTGLRKRADAAREAQRLAEIALLAKRIDKLAATAQDNAELAQALADIAAAAVKARDLAAQQDAALRELADEARALDVGPAAPNGLPQKRHGGVAVTGDGMVHGQQRVSTIGARIDEAVNAAAASDLDDAKAAIAVVTGIEPTPRAAYYLVGANGMVCTFDELSGVIQKQVAAGELRLLTERETRAWLTTGSIDG